MYSNYKILIYFISTFFSVHLFALDPIDDNFFKYSSGNFISKKADPEMVTAINTLKITDTLDALHGSQHSCSLPTETLENGRIKSFGTCSLDLGGASDFSYISDEYENINDKNIPAYLREYLDE